MNLKKIQAFNLVVQKRSFSEAASALGLTQPAISNHVKSLEEELGVTLIERNPSSIHPTPAGNYVYNMGRVLLAQWRELEEGVTNFQGTLTGNMKVGASTIPGTYLLPKWVGEFLKLYPKVELINEISDSYEILSRISKRQVDIGITGDRFESPEIVSQLVATDTLVLISPNGHPLVSSTYNRNLCDLIQYDFVFRETGSGTRKTTEKGLNKLGLELDKLRVVAQFGSTEAIISAVEVGLGLSFVSRLAAAPAVAAGRVQFVSNLETFKQDYYLSYLKSREEHPIIREFMNIVCNRKYCSNIEGK